jgi:hypothetical protein
MSKNPDDVVYVLFTFSIQDLEGKLLTYLDAILTDPVQRKAAKDIIRPMIWEWAITQNFADQHEIKNSLTGEIVSNKVVSEVISGGKKRTK